MRRDSGARQRRTLLAHGDAAPFGCLRCAPARALDKQGSAHGGEVGGADSGFAISGSLLGGIAFFNPTYAARPDNTGKALLRLAPHLDIDLIGSRLSIPVDINVFTDRERPACRSWCRASST